MKSLLSVLFAIAIFIAAIWYFGPVVIYFILGAIAFVVFVCFLEVLCWVLGI